MADTVPPFEVTVSALGVRGDGVAETPAGPLYIPLTIPGDRVLVRLGEARGNGRAAEVITLLSPGPGRADPPCPHFGVCGGCALQHLAEQPYAHWKVDRLVRALQRIGLGGVCPEPLVRTPLASRRRAAFDAALLPGGRVALGFHRRRGAALVDLDVCPVLDPLIVAILPALRDFLAGWLQPGQRISVLVSRLDGGLDVVLRLPKAPTLALREALATMAHGAGIARLSWRLDEAAAEPIVCRQEISVQFGGTAVDLPPGGFLQASREGEVALVAVIGNATTGAGTAADLFAGAGTFTFPLLRAGVRVHAVDADAALLQALVIAARRLPAGSPPVTTEQRDLFARPLPAAVLSRFDAVLFDPPRAGAAAQAAELARSTVPTVVGVSCHPESFARDARTLADGGFRLERVLPVDQFLFSPHLEVVGVFRR